MAKTAVQSNKVTVIQETTTAIQVGKDYYLVKTTSDGRGVHLENKEHSIFIPFGEGGKAIVNSLTEKVNAVTPKQTKRRRTQLEIMAQGGGHSV